MSEKKVLVTKSILTDIASTIRDREGSVELIKPVDFAAHIAAMSLGQQGAPVSSITITNKDQLKSVRPNVSAEIEVAITPEWEGWTYTCTSSNPAVISVSSVLNHNGRYEVTGVKESDEPVTITVSAGDFSDSVQMECRDLFEPDLSKALDAEQLANLKNIVASGAASNYLSTGQKLLVKYGSYTMPFEVVGFEDVTIEGGDTVHALNLLAQYTDETGSTWASSGSIKYSASALRTRVTAMKGNLDSNFVACLAKTKVQTYSRDGSTDIVYDELFAPSMSQLGVTDTSYTTAQQTNVEGPAFTAYKGAANAKRVKQAINATGTAQYYWTRSLYSGYSAHFGLVSTSGAPNRDLCSLTGRVVVACNFIG